MFFSIDGIEGSDTIVEIEQYFSLYFIEEKNLSEAGRRKLMHESLNTISNELKIKLIKEIAETQEIEKEMIEKFKERSIFDKDKLTGSGLVSKMTEIDTLINFPISYFSDKDISNGIAFSIYNSENIIKQDGVFTWNSSFDKPLEVVAQEQFLETNGSVENYRFSESYNINKKLDPYIRSKLEMLGINRKNIYPDTTIDARPIYTNCKEN